MWLLGVVLWQLTVLKKRATSISLFQMIFLNDAYLKIGRSFHGHILKKSGTVT